MTSLANAILDQPVAVWPLNERFIVKSITARGGLYSKSKGKLTVQPIPKGFPLPTNPADHWFKRFGVEATDPANVAVQLRPLLSIERTEQGDYNPMYDEHPAIEASRENS